MILPESANVALIMALLCLWIMAVIAGHVPEECNDPNHKNWRDRR